MHGLSADAEADTTLDLGELVAPALIFGGTYSNLEATEAVLAAAGRHGIPPERVICTGDVVAYCADPDDTTTLVRESGVHVLMGNCEESLAAGAMDCGCGFEPGTQCDALSAQWYRYATAHLVPAHRAWMGQLPRAIRFGLNGVRFLTVHGTVSSINQFVFASTPEGVMRGELDLTDTDGVIGGHCGMPFSRAVDGRIWHNSGAVGMPANDGTPRVWYSMIAPAARERRAVTITHHALKYDHARAAAKMRKRGQPEGYAQALESGMWPSLDVLPPREKADTGVALPLDGQVITFRSSRPSAESARLKTAV